MPQTASSDREFRLLMVASPEGLALLDGVITVEVDPLRPEELTDSLCAVIADGSVRFRTSDE